MADLKGGSTVSGYEIWHSGNDGANSGLDADRVKGINWIVSPTAPPQPQTFDVWVDTTNFIINIWNGTVWRKLG